MIALWFLLLAAPDGGTPALVVRPDGPNRYLVSAAELDLDAWSRSVRVVPAFQNGQAQGFKLFAIRPGSPAHRLGLANGDTVRSIGGRPLTSPDEALAVYAWLRTARTVEVQLERKGEPLTLTYIIEGDQRDDRPFVPPPPRVPEPELDLRGRLQGDFAFDFGVGTASDGRVQLRLSEATLSQGDAQFLRLGTVLLQAHLTPAVGEDHLIVDRIVAEGGDITLTLAGENRIRRRPDQDWAQARVELAVDVELAPDHAARGISPFTDGRFRLRCFGPVAKPRCAPTR